MKITTITYQKTFPLAPYVNEKIGVEIQLDADDNPDGVLSIAKETVEKWHKENNPHPYSNNGVEYGKEVMTIRSDEPAVVTVSRESRTEAIIRDINSCKELKVLESYKFIVRNNPELQEVYEKKLMEFQK